MSRTHIYEYVIRLHGDTTIDEWDSWMDAVCEAVEKRWTPYYWSCGSASYKPVEAGGPIVSYLVVANKAKAKRLASALDDELGVTGDLIEWLPL